ncbi:Zinc finger, DHHC-type, palmitoyltransferase [Cynara cardunculus var. scolymus]|uniref:S-acyltransferase n=1 Tax=Cynara cardunculus var. scolymus TaxID=59895 RepID=A0A124SG45_CYNCS|nr:Zinc finger, DHHC-type, palmitoyltransferase [Cynara cardunculus var. scolymus]
MDVTDSATTTLPPPPPSSESAPLLSDSTLQQASPQEDHCVASITEDHEVTCWGCGLCLILSPYTPIFKCGWCGAITNHNARKIDNTYFWWRRLRDRCFVCVLLLFMLFIIGGGIWAIYPIVFSFSYFCGIFHMTLSIILSIGNCVGAANHRVFIIFLISAVISNLYVSLISSFTAFHIWPPIRQVPIAVLSSPSDYMLVYSFLKETALSFSTSVESLSLRGFILIYLFLASVSVEIGLGVLLWQQLSYVYQGKTYLSHLSSRGTNRASKKDCQNIVRFFGCPYSATRCLLGFWNSRKTHKK